MHDARFIFVIGRNNSELNLTTQRVANLMLGFVGMYAIYERYGHSIPQAVVALSPNYHDFTELNFDVAAAAVVWAPKKLQTQMTLRSLEEIECGLRPIPKFAILNLIKSPT